MVNIPIIAGMRELSPEQEDMLHELFTRVSGSTKRLCITSVQKGDHLSFVYVDGKFDRFETITGKPIEGHLADVLKCLPGFIGRLSPAMQEVITKLDVVLTIDPKSFGVSTEKTSFLNVPGFSGMPHKIDPVSFILDNNLKPAQCVNLGFRLNLHKVYKQGQHNPQNKFTDFCNLLVSGAKFPPDMVLQECRPPIATFDNFMDDVVQIIRGAGKGLSYGSKNTVMLELCEND